MSNYKTNNPTSVRSLFNAIAKKYDTTNSFLSFHLHSLWNTRLARAICESLTTVENPVVVDLCAGTGEIAFQIPRYHHSIVAIHLLDFSKEMLAVAHKKQKLLPEDMQKLFFLHEADATDVPFDDASVDAITIAYGIRNIAYPEKCLQECARILKPGRTVAILELTRPQNRFLSWLHSLFLHVAVPFIGAVITQDKEAYSYLKKTIHSFLAPNELVGIALQSGFRNPVVKPLMGGIATLFLFEKSRS
jgi:demethylmenaquinone methyltransferase/2-methoxy-6-polyprenyl-1,4-benzoquinol methylase